MAMSISDTDLLENIRRVGPSRASALAAQERDPALRARISRLIESEYASSMPGRALSAVGRLPAAIMNRFRGPEARSELTRASMPAEQPARDYADEGGRGLAAARFGAPSVEQTAPVQVADVSEVVQEAPAPAAAVAVPRAITAGAPPPVAAVASEMSAVPGVGEAAATTPQEGISEYERAAEAARQRMAVILGRANEAGASDRDKWLALALGGARMAASRNPTFFGALGEGAEAGLGAVQSADQRARATAFRKADQELGAEAAAERAGAQAENRVIRREDIANRAVARQDALEARREELAARMEDRRLSREERADAARQLRETQLEIARLNVAGRENVANIRAKAAGANGTREQRWIEYARERGIVDNSPEGDIKALGMIRPNKGADMQRTQANIAASIYRTMLQDPLDRRSPEEKQAAAAAAAGGFLGDSAPSAGGEPAAPPAAPAPAPATPPSSAGPVRVTTPAEAQALPKGTRYITPDGRQLVR